jgi:nitrogenase molybdenum-iron protein NifN
MATVTNNGRRAVIDPLKLSRPLGASLAFLGVSGCMPMLHGSQGCTAFAKALLTKHFREPIPLQTSAVTELTAVLGSAQNLVEALDTVRAKQRPEIIGVITTGVAEVSGEDLQAAMRLYRAGLGPGDPLIVFVSAPDFHGGLSDGWSSALNALVEAGLHDPADSGYPADAQGRLDDLRAFPVLAGVSLTAAELDEISLMVESFGLDPVLVPDLSASLDGHLGSGWTPLTTGGTTRSQLARLGATRHAHAVGTTAAAAAETLALGSETDVVVSRHLAGLDAVDAFVARLWQVSERDVPARIRRARSRFADGLLDTHFALGGARIALALEPELLAATADLLASTGAEIVTAVSPTSDPVLRDLPCDEVVVGDHVDLRERAAEAGAQVVVGSSHAVAAATEIGARHVPLGVPIEHRYGSTLLGVSGYAGGLRFITDVANALLERTHQTHQTHQTRPFSARKDQP